VKRARIPAGYELATLENFKPLPHNRQALGLARKFVADFTPGGKTAGLLLTGSVGTGKTHLAVGVLRKLAEVTGVEGRFVDVRELLDRLRSSYDASSFESQAGILKPILAADLVVVDELGAARPTDWSFETIELLIGGLYNRCVPIIVTTNFANLSAGGQAAGGNEYARAARQETLGDRIGTRMWSRLQQMCLSVDMSGPDWRMGCR
jgi:DNA replication protein DnaC